VSCVITILFIVFAEKCGKTQGKGKNGIERKKEEKRKKEEERKKEKGIKRFLFFFIFHFLFFFACEYCVSLDINREERREE
jgi:hypothetical protein